MKNNSCEEIKYSVVVPIFNEQDTITLLYSCLKPVMDGLGEKYEAIFIDDGSNDSSLIRLNALSQTHKNIRIIHFDSNRGQGKAIEDGFKNAKGRIIITIDGDLQNDPSDIPNLIAQINAGFDVVCGWRAGRSDTLFKKVKSKIGNFLQRKITHLSLHDMSCTLRVYRKEMVMGIVFQGKFDFSMLPYIISKRKQARIIEVRVKDNYRKFGKTKYKFFNTIFGTVCDYIRLVFLVKMPIRKK